MAQRKNAKGSGTIRKKTVTRGGKSYTYWEARLTVGRDPGTGKQLQRSFTGKTQQEVRQKLAQAVAALDTGTYTAPQKMTVGEWLDIWQKEYWGNLKPSTAIGYASKLNAHIRPGLGAVRLADLHPHMVQGFINSLDGLAPSTVHHVYKVLHLAMAKAVELDYIPRNPAARCVLPKNEQREIKPLDDQQVAALLAAAKGGDMEHFISVALFTGMRMSELLGLTWDAIDLEAGTISINKQLAMTQHRKAGLFITPKSGKSRTIAAAPSAIAALKRQRTRQAEMQLKAGPLWDNPHQLVFTRKTGGPIDQHLIHERFVKLLRAAGLEGVRLHDLRHTYAVMQFAPVTISRAYKATWATLPPLSRWTSTATSQSAWQRTAPPVWKASSRTC